MKKRPQSSLTLTITLKVEGEPLVMTMTVPQQPVKPYRMLPVFHKMANTLVDKSVRETEETGKKISCKMGCGACCRQMVPIAEIEAYQLAGLVDRLPEPRRTQVRQRFDDAYTHFAGIGWFNQLSNLVKPSREDLVRLGLEYFRDGVACPFLVDESCSIHDDRPVSCREYLVTSPAENCSSPSAQSIETVKLPLKPSGPLMRLGQTQSIAGVTFLPLVLALKWVEKNPDTLAEKTGGQWMADFFENLTGATIPEPTAAK